MASSIERAGGEELFLVPSATDAGLALVFGLPTATRDLGDVVDALPLELSKRVAEHLGLAGMLGASVESGRWVRLAAESMEKVKELGFTRGADGAASGVLRSANGQIAHFLKFDLTSPVGVDPVTFATALAMQQMVRQIEKKLEDIATDVQGLVRGERNKLEAKLASAVDVIERVERNTSQRGLVSDDDWQSLAVLETLVKDAYHQTVLWLEPLNRFLLDGELSLAEQVKLLSKEHGLRDADYWLRMHVHSELALKRWEMLYLIRRSDVAPDGLAEDATDIQRRAEERHTRLAGIAELIGLYLDDDGSDGRWTDRFRFISRHRLERLRHELAQVANAYASALGRSEMFVPAYADVEDPGPIIDLEGARRFMSEKAAPQLKERAASFVGFGKLAAGRVGDLMRRSESEADD